MSTKSPISVCVIVGATGGIGAALLAHVTHAGLFDDVTGLGRATAPAIDLLSEVSIAAAAHAMAANGELRLVIDATGFLHGDGFTPEKSWRELDPAHLQRSFAINAIGPALLMKHVLPLLPASGKSVFATLSARVGSIGDNGLGGWYSYRAAKAALNQLVRTASIELKRRKPDAICVALHPGTVDTGLSTPFIKSGLDVQSPASAAARLIATIDRLRTDDSGSFLDQNGQPISW